MVLKKKRNFQREESLKYKIPCNDLGYNVQHLVLIVEHSIQLGQIKVPEHCSTWENLLQHNQHLIDSKNRLKELFNINHFSQFELDTLAVRTTEIVKKYYPHLIIHSVVSVV